MEANAALRHLYSFADRQKINAHKCKTDIESLEKTLEIYKQSIRDTEEAIRVLENAQASTSTETT